MAQSRNRRFHIIVMFNCLSFLAALPAPRRDGRALVRSLVTPGPPSFSSMRWIGALVLARAGAPLPHQTDGDDRNESVPHAL